MKLRYFSVTGRTHSGAFRNGAAFLAGALLLAGTWTAAAQDSPAPGESAAVTPASDKEETGALTDMLPDFKDPLTLPEQERGRDYSTFGIAADGPGLFPSELWSGDRSEPPPPGEEPAPAPNPAEEDMLTPEVLESCFGSVPPPPLHDPQHLLLPAQAEPLAQLLGESLNARETFLTSVVLMRPSQQIPPSLNPPELLQSWHGNNKSVLILYFMGRPDRTQAFFSPEVRRQHRGEDLRQVIDFGVREAARMTTPLGQLQRFCYKTAIRLDRLHRQGVVAPTDEPLPPAAAAAPGDGSWWTVVIGIHAAGLSAAALWWWRRRRAAANGTGSRILLPEQDLVTRLGAPHSGGFGAVLQFGPARQ
jgi:hypothetical protein